MRRSLIPSIAVAGLLFVGALGVTLPAGVRMLVAIAFLAALSRTGWRVAGALAPESDAVSRAANAGLVAAATISVPATVLGHFGHLSPRAILLVVFAAFLASAALPRHAPPRHASSGACRAEALVLLAVAGAFAGLLVHEAETLRFDVPGARSYDDPSYHLSAVATWRTFGDLRMIKFPVGDPATAFYPIAGELCTFGLVAALDPSDFLARFGELPFALLSLVAVAAVARRLGLSPVSGAVAALLYAANPRFVILAFSAGTDHVTAFFLLASAASALALAERPTLGRAVLLGLSIGLLAGTKYTGLQFALALVPLALAAWSQRWRLAPASLAVAAVAGGYTYLRNLLATGNPIFPAQVRLFGWTLFPGWVDPRGFVKNELFAIDVPSYLVRADLFGALLPWILVPAALAAWLAALARRERLRTVLALALPIGVFLSFRFLMYDHRDARYIFGGVALAGVCAVWLAERLPERAARAVRAALALAAVASALVAAGAREPLAWGAAAALAAEALRRALRLRVRTIAVTGACAGVVIAAVAGPGLLGRYEHERARSSPLYGTLDERTRAAPAAVAYVGGNQPYFCWGSALQNRVLFVPTFADERASYYDFRSGLAMPREKTSRPDWWANLVREKVRYVVVVRGGFELPELGWIDAEPERFVHLASDGVSGLFEVRPGAVSRPILRVDAAGPWASSYFVGDWAMERADDGGPALAPLADARLKLPRFEMAVRAMRLELDPAPGAATLRSCDDLVGGTFATDAREVVLPLPPGFDATCIAIAAQGTPGPFRVGRTDRLVPHPLRATSASARDATVLSAGAAQEVRRAPGYTLARLSADGARFAEVRTFDVSRDASASRALAAWIARLSAGAVVLGGVSDDASGITEEGAAALGRLGCMRDVRGHPGLAHAFIGVAGAAPGTVPEGIDARSVLVAAPSGPIRVRAASLLFDEGHLVRPDPGLLCGVDEPLEGASVSGPIRVRGWCQERGGGILEPRAFLVDGRRLSAGRIERSPRPDVAAAFAGMGDVSRAGYETLLDAGALAPGRHVLVVRFDAPDGRYRLYEPRTFVLEPARAAATPR